MGDCSSFVAAWCSFFLGPGFAGEVFTLFGRYSVPPSHVVLPAEVLDEQGEPLQDRAGFRRDLLPRQSDVLAGMKRCFSFVGREPNQELFFTDAGLEKFRCFDAYNWKLAGHVQYVDDQLAAELRQVQLRWFCFRSVDVVCFLRLGLRSHCVGSTAVLRVFILGCCGTRPFCSLFAPGTAAFGSALRRAFGFAGLVGPPA